MSAYKFLNGIDLQGNRGISAADAVGATDLTTLQQVQALVLGLSDLKDPVRSISITNITLSGTQTIDGVNLVAGDRHLAAGQTGGATNGIYVVAAGAWTRAVDADTSAEITKGMATTVLEGTQKGTGVNASNPVTWILTTNNPITLNTTALTFAPIGTAATAYLAGNGLTLSGSTFSVQADATAADITVGPSGIKVTPGVYTKKYAADIGALTAGTPLTITHNLGTSDVVVATRINATGEVVDLGAKVTGVNTVTVEAAAAQTASIFRITVVG